MIFRYTVGKIIRTFFLIFFIVCTFASGPMVAFLLGVVTEDFPYDAKISKLNLSSTVYITDDASGVTKEYTKAYTNENRIWVDFKKIPKAMKDAIIAIEDKRFYRHFGVDPKRLFGAFLSFLGGRKVYGGSTLTQQLIKNITGENDVSITRKLKEVIRALNFERKFSKDEILELYLNIAYFGNGCFGVEAAANFYFGKKINECSTAECAAIAGITQNPYANNPFLNPENNKERRELVLSEMLAQSKITEEEHKNAVIESSKMTFKRRRNVKKHESGKVHDWYTEALFNDVINDLSIKYKLRRDVAEKMLYTQGLKIYSAMDPVAQDIAQKVICDSSMFSGDKRMETGFFMMAPDGRVLAIIGSRNKKTANRILCRATLTKRQPGSAFKPLSVYAPAMDLGIINLSSKVNDSPVKDYYGPGKSGPRNWYGNFKGEMPLSEAIRISANAPVANLLLRLTNRNSYNFLTRKLNFSHLDEVDLVSSPALALGGLHKGVTVKEMAAGFQIFCNGGIYNRPYTYHYVLDNSGKVLLDNRNQIGNRVIKQDTANNMNKLLKGVVTSGTGRAANISGVDVIGKTGTTDNHKDSWFVGATPVAVAAIWTGYDIPASISSTHYAKAVFKEIMSQYVAKKGGKKVFGNREVSEKSEEKYCCKETGLLAVDGCPVKIKAYYNAQSTPKYCDKHSASTKTDVSSNEEENRTQGSANESQNEEDDDLQEIDENIEESAIEADDNG